MLQDAAIPNITYSLLQTTSAPKVHGSFNLLQSTMLQPTTAVIFYSSIASLLGSAGQAAYAAANAAIDALASTTIYQVNKARHMLKSMMV